MGRRILRITKTQRKAAAELGRMGGKTRARNLTAAERKAIAIKAGKASVQARRRKIAERQQG